MNNQQISGIWIKGKGECAPYLRKCFELSKVTQKAILNLCGLGWHELYINGKKADERVLSPVVTQFDKHVNYIEYDVSDLLTVGTNAITVLLGNGWYNPQVEDVWQFSKAPWRDDPKMLCELICDGKSMLCSDETWKTHDSPIISNGLRSGETYDARKEVPKVFEADLDDSAWGNVLQTSPPGGVVVKEEMEPCKVTQIINPVKESWVQGNMVVYDFGINLTGWCEVELEGDSGAHIKIQYGEMVRDNMDLDRGYIAGKFEKPGEFQTDCYYLKGGEKETWHPRFTYHGFRYAKVYIWGGDVKIKSIKACFIHNSFADNGQFSCSDYTADKLQEITRQSYLANFTGIPTDCPHREKNGWSGDVQLACETGLWNYSATESYKNYIRVLADTQRPSGQLSGIAPCAGWGYNWGSGPAWDICLFEVPYQVYRFTGDTEMIVEHYGAMRKYVAYCKSMARDNLVNFGLGDWCHVDNKRIAPVELTSSAYYYYAAKLLSFFADLLGYDEDKKEYSTLSVSIAEAINREYANGDGTYANGEWTAMSCVLYFGIAPQERCQAIADLLADRIMANDCKIDFGILGAKFTPRVLADYGHADVAFKMITQPEFPGWGHWIEMGATTLWEHWTGVASRNHIMFGDISAWFYQYIAGLSPDVTQPGFKHVVIKPHPITSLECAKAEYVSPYGKITVAWKQVDGTFKLKVNLPKSVTATVTLPDNKVRNNIAGNNDFTVTLLS